MRYSHNARISILMVVVIPYVEPKDEAKNDFSSTFTSTMPMAAVRVMITSGDETVADRRTDVHPE